MGRENVEIDASHVQTDRACQESEHRAIPITAPEAMPKAERNRCIQYWGSGVQDRAGEATRAG